MVSRNASGICDRRGTGVRLILSLPDSRLHRRNDRKADTKPAPSRKRDQRYPGRIVATVVIMGFFKAVGRIAIEAPTKAHVIYAFVLALDAPARLALGRIFCVAHINLEHPGNTFVIHALPMAYAIIFEFIDKNLLWDGLNIYRRD
jgi:hypothetical protein